MSGSDENRPLAVIEETWREYKRWARTSRQGKAVQTRARNLSLSFGLAGAVLAVLSGSGYMEGIPAQVLAMASAFFIAVAGYLGRELLTPERETVWARCRMLAEALQRQVWLALMQVPPYRGDAAFAAVRERTKQLIDGADLSQVSQAEGATHEPLPQVAGVEDYIRLRLEDQSTFYRSAAGKLQKSLETWRRISLVLGIVAILLGVLGVKFSFLPLWVPVVTSMSAAVLALVQAGRFQSLTPLYQQTARQLELELAAWKDGEYDDASVFAAMCEEIMARESESWRTEWLSKEARDASRQALARAQQAAVDVAGKGD